MQALLQSIWETLLALAPWLLLGMLIAGVIHVLLPAGFVHRQFRGRRGVLKAVALGVPLPLCSCGVIPAGLGLRRDGASRGSSVGFLISTPQTGVDSILVSASFLGWPFALFKVLSAAATGIVGGLVADSVADDPEADAEGDVAPVNNGPRGPRALAEHAIDILRTIRFWIVVGVLVSAAIEVFLPGDFFTALLGDGALLPLLAVLLVSVPLYVCATASVPIAAALVSSGMPAGAALVFLMAGPATNVATIGAIYRGLGRRSLAVYLLTIVGGSVLFGLTFDFLIPPARVTAQHLHGDGAWWSVASAILLVGLLAWFAFEDVRRSMGRLLSRLRRGEPSVEIGVSGMTCGGCASKLERALAQAEGVTSATVTLEPGRAVVCGSIGEARVREIVENAGFGAPAAS